MGRWGLAPTLAGLMLGWSGESQAVSTYVEVVILDPGTSLDQCLAAAEQAVAGQGLNRQEGTSSGDIVWANDQATRRLYYVFCLTDQNVAVFSGSAPDDDSVDQIGTELSALRARFQAAIELKSAR